MLRGMTRRGRDRKPRSPKRDLRLLAIPGGLMWLMFVVLNVIFPGRSSEILHAGVLNLAGLLLLCVTVVAGITALAVVAPLRWRAPVAVLDLSYPVAFVVMVVF